MMGAPLPIRMIFPKIQEEFRKIIEKGEMLGFTVSVEKSGIRMSSPSGVGVLVTPEMEYDEIEQVVKNFSNEVFDNGK